ncbi:MAG: LamG-like jellyroll fold domain-containing protein [Spirochaetia bacterium]
MKRNALRIGSVVLLIMVLGSCASMKLENYRFSGAEDSFATDFSENDGKLELTPGASVENGVLHLNPIDGPSAAGIKYAYGMNSVTRFRVKVTSDGPELFYNMLVRFEGGHTRLATILRRQNTHIFASENGENVYNNFTESGYLRPGQWHDVVIILHNGEYRLFVDGRLRKTLTVPAELPREGYANFEYHNEAWVDDLEITKIDGFTVE